MSEPAWTVPHEYEPCEGSIDHPCATHSLLHYEHCKVCGTDRRYKTHDPADEPVKRWSLTLIADCTERHAYRMAREIDATVGAPFEAEFGEGQTVVSEVVSYDVGWTCDLCGAPIVDSSRGIVVENQAEFHYDCAKAEGIK